MPNTPASGPAARPAESVATWMGVAAQLADALRNSTSLTIQGAQDRLDALRTFEDARDDAIDRWHDTDDARPIWEALGWSRERYAAYVSQRQSDGPESLEKER